MGGGGRCSNCCVGNCCVSNCDYHPGPSESELHAKKIADELAAMKENMRNATENMEREIIDNINYNLDEFISELERINQNEYGGKKLNIDIQTIRDEKQNLANSVIGSTGDFIDSRLIINDPELKVILEERDDKKRAKNFDKFIMDLREKSTTKLEDRVRKTVLRQNENIKNRISSRMTEVQNNMKTAFEAYNEVLKAKEQGEKEQKRTIAKYSYKHELCSILLDETES